MPCVHINKLDATVISDVINFLHTLLRTDGVPDVKIVLKLMLRFFFYVKFELELMVSIPGHTNQTVIS